jgi:general transcription factor IIIA
MEFQTTSMTSLNLKKEAQRVFDSILLDEGTNFFALYGKALTMYKDGKLDECAETMRQAIEVEPVDSGCNAKTMLDKILKLVEKRSQQQRQERGKPENLLIRNLILRQPIVDHKPGESFPADGSKKSHFCKICEKHFTKQFSLNRHMQLHTGERPHKCSFCRKGFIQKTDMERHETTHSDQLNFHCTFEGCGKSFKTKKNLNCHFVTHSDDRPFKCRHCDKDFKVKRLLRFHEELHKDTLPYNCDQCGKGFVAKSYLKNHLKTHIDEKPRKEEREN